MDERKEGRVEAHDLAYETMKRLRTSLEDTANLYEMGVVTSQMQVEIEKLRFAADTLIFWYHLYGDAFDEMTED